MPTDPEYVFDDPLPLTGERTAPGIPEENYWFQRHVVAYEWAARRTAGRRVLDAGCGEGYGTQILAATAGEVVGVDLEAGVVERAAARYPSARFEPADLEALPYPDASFDAVVSLQVIEHMRSPVDFCGEAARVLRPGGEFLCATPNRITFSPRGIRNAFHTVEFSPAELRAVLARHFTVTEMLGTFHAGRIRATEIATRSSLPERLIATPVPQWSQRRRAAVARITTRDFRIRGEHLDRSLDLIAVGRR
ncbi:MAG TPA: class I SAM-dependent methyltransferase [Actinomycetota bacterium]